jgi:acid phosphatase
MGEADRHCEYRDIPTEVQSMFRKLQFPLALLLLSGALVAQQIPSSHHVYIVAEENTSYEHEVGSSNMPYVNSLIKEGALATQFYANQHSSLPDYFWVTAGQVMTENNDTLETFNVDNIVRHAMQLGLTYKSYAETLPHAGYAGLYSGNYMKRHCPLPYYSDMGNSKSEMLKHVPLTDLASDIKNDTLPNFAFITPDATDDMHNCPNGTAACEKRADTWLKNNIGPLLASKEFQPGGDGLLILWADEADLGTDNRCSSTVKNGCGGRILVAMIGPNVKKGYQSTVLYHHPNVLRTMLEAMGDTSSFPGAANTAVPMSDMFQGGSTAYGVSVSSPANNSTVPTTMQVMATATAAKPIKTMQVYVDSKLAYSVNASSINADLNISAGGHDVVVQAWDTAGNVQKEAVSVTATAEAALTISSPTPGETITGGEMTVVAAASVPSEIKATAIYVDGVEKYSINAATVNTNIAVTTGSHTVVVQQWNDAGNVVKASVQVTAK